MNPDIQDFTIAVQTFVETSSVGEFGHRIHLLKAFNREMLQKGKMTISAHILNMSQLLFILSHAGGSNVASVLDNTFHFYSQFLPAVNTAIQQLTGPLEKEFKVVILKANKHMNFLNFFWVFHLVIG